MNFQNLKYVLRIVGYLFSFLASFIAVLFITFAIIKPFNLQQIGINAVFSVLFSLAFVGVTYLFWCKLEKRSWSLLGLNFEKLGAKEFALGFLGATLFLGLQALLGLGLGWFQLATTPTEPLPAAEFSFISVAILVLIGTLASGVCEELAFRGYLLTQLRESLPLWISIALSSVLFAVVVHFNKLTPEYFVFLTLMGVLFAQMRLHTKTLWFCIGFHWSYNWTQAVLWGSGKRALYRFEPTVTSFSDTISIGPDAALSSMLLLFLILILLIPRAAYTSR